MLHTVIFIGRSGCGKGTQADLLKERIIQNDDEKRHILYVETGEHFRKFMRGQGYTSALANVVSESGKRQPAFLGCYMWSHVLIEELGENMHLMFDGSPRAEDEAMVLTSALKFYKRERVTVFYINVSRKWSEEKLLARGRLDDKTLAKIDQRLDWFDADTMPAIEYMKNHSPYNVIEINGEQSVEKVHQEIVKSYEHQS